MARSVAAKAIVAKVAYGVSCVLALSVLLVSGKAHQTLDAVASIGKSDAITGSGPSVGEMNILVMGLESRRDWNGNVLPPEVLAQLHAGSTNGVTNEGVGGNATNTLILIHIFKGGHKAVGISIPRDDWVTYAQNVNGTLTPATYDGSSQGKIDNAYGYALDQTENANAGRGLSQNELAFKGNEAGRKAAIATVEYLTGVHIDHFAEVNLDGFYELAKVLGGIYVCMKHPVPYDSYSGFFAHHAGMQHLDAKGALAFVRQRHGLLNGDLDRTHRQQAFVDSVIHQLKTEGALTDFFKLDGLLAAADQYVITDKGWDLKAFATDMGAFSGRNLSFQTAKVDGYSTINGQAANTITPATIQAQVQAAFNPPTRTGKAAGKKQLTDPNPSLTTVVVQNGTKVPGLAGNVSAALVKEGYKQGTIGDTTTPQAATTVLYGTGAATSGQVIAAQFGVTAQASSQIPAGTVQVLLGPGVDVAQITAPAAGSGSGAAGGTASTPTPSSTYNPAGGTVKVPASGIPCVD